MFNNIFAVPAPDWINTRSCNFRLKLVERLLSDEKSNTGHGQISRVSPNRRSVETLHDCIQMRFEDELRLAVYEDFEVDPAKVDIAELVAKRFSSVTHGKDSISLLLPSSAGMKIDLTTDPTQAIVALSLCPGGSCGKGIQVTRSEEVFDWPTS